MSRFRIAVRVVPRRGILDPQGNAVADALRTLGFSSVHDVHVGRLIIVEVEAASPADAESSLREMCRRLLANPVTEDFVIEHHEPAAAGAV